MKKKTLFTELPVSEKKKMVFGIRRPSQSVGIFLSCITAIFSGTVLVQMLFSSVAPQPYMDEIFHVDQMQRYCQNRLFEWNPKLTTPPGLYLFILAMLKPVMIFIRKNAASACTVSVLRYFNGFFVTLLFCANFALFRTLNSHKRTSSVIISISALNLTLFPVCYFFSFLFYTDVLSVLSVLFAYLLQQHRYLKVSALVGLFSCLMRQTNIVWVAFCAACTASEITVQYAVHFENKRKVEKSTKRSDNHHYSLTSVARQQQQHQHTVAREQQQNSQPDFYYDPTALAFSLHSMINEKPNLFVNFLVTVIVRCAGYILVGVLFVVAVIFNGGIALGDRSAHQACLHLPQAFYCAGFILAFGSPLILLPHARSIVSQIKKHAFLSRCLVFVILICVYGFTYDHPYLLADNRHFTFYIWRRYFMAHPLAKYLLTPGYIFACYSCWYLLVEQPTVWRYLFIGTVVIVTIPNRLLEFRYFILPYYFWRLHLPLQSKTLLTLEFILYALINLFTLYLFLFKPFVWTHEPGTQRFMW